MSINVINFGDYKKETDDVSPEDFFNGVAKKVAQDDVSAAIAIMVQSDDEGNVTGLCFTECNLSPVELIGVMDFARSMMMDTLKL